MHFTLTIRNNTKLHLVLLCLGKNIKEINTKQIAGFVKIYSLFSKKGLKSLKINLVRIFKGLIYKKHGFIEILFKFASDKNIMALKF